MRYLYKIISMEFFEHLKTYLTDQEISLLETSLKEKSQHALLLNTDKMSQDTLLSINQECILKKCI